MPKRSSTTSFATGADEEGGSMAAGGGMVATGGLSSPVTVVVGAVGITIADEGIETLVVDGTAKLIFIYYSHKNGLYYSILSSIYE